MICMYNSLFFIDFFLPRNIYFLLYALYLIKIKSIQNKYIKKIEWFEIRIKNVEAADDGSSVF